MIRSLRMTIHKEGRKILISLFFSLVLLDLLVWIFGGHLAFVITLAASTSLFLFITNFFRSPKRVSNPNPEDILAPADGKVVVVEKVYEQGLLKEDRIQLSIFMSISTYMRTGFPLKEKSYTTATRTAIFGCIFAKSSSENERSTVLIRSPYNGQTLLVVKLPVHWPDASPMPTQVRKHVSTSTQVS